MLGLISPLNPLFRGTNLFSEHTEYSLKVVTWPPLSLLFRQTYLAGLALIPSELIQVTITFSPILTF